MLNAKERRRRLSFFSVTHRPTLNYFEQFSQNIFKNQNK